jgi:hypothetical protein
VLRRWWVRTPSRPTPELVDVSLGSGSGASEELEADAMVVLPLVGLGEAEATEVVSWEVMFAAAASALTAAASALARHWAESAVGEPDARWRPWNEHCGGSWTSAAMAPGQRWRVRHV